MIGSMPFKDPAKVRAASKRHYDKNPEYYKERNRRSRERKQDFIRQQRSVPCVDCKTEYPWYVMEFDHRNAEDKTYNIARMNSQSWNRIHTELAKCDVLCANCHCVRTHERRGSVAQRQEASR